MKIENPTLEARSETVVPAAPPRVFTGAGWLALSKLFSQVFSWVGTFYVAGKLLPSDYGLSNLSTAFTEFAVILTNLGIGTTMVQKQQIDKEEVDNLFTATVMLGMLLALSALGLAYFGAWYFKNQALAPLTQFTALLYLVSAVTIVPYNFLNRDMRFKERGLLDMYSVIASITTQIVLATLHFGVWTLLWGSAVRFGVRLALAFHYSGYRPAFRFKWALLKEDLGFSAQLTLNWFLFVLKERVIPVIIGRTYTVAEMGLLGFAGSLSSIPNLKIVQLLREVLLPLLSKRAHNPEDQLRGLGTALKMMMLLVIPVYLCGFYYGTDVLAHILPAKWTPMFPIFEALCLVQMWNVLASIVAIYNTAQGKPVRSTWFELANAIAIPAATFAFRRFDLIHLAHLWSALGGSIFLGWFALLFHRRGRFLGNFFGLTATVACLCGAVFVGDDLLLRPWLGAGVSGIALRTAAFLAVYGGFLAIFHGGFIKGLRKK